MCTVHTYCKSYVRPDVQLTVWVELNAECLVSDNPVLARKVEIAKFLEMYNHSMIIKRRGTSKDIMADDMYILMYALANMQVLYQNWHSAG